MLSKQTNTEANEDRGMRRSGRKAHLYLGLRVQPSPATNARLTLDDRGDPPRSQETTHDRAHVLGSGFRVPLAVFQTQKEIEWVSG